MRIGSTWIKLDDHINNLKHREETVQVKADLEDANEPGPSGGLGSKKKKKKKKAKGKKADLDLDMDEDDPTA